MFYAGDSPILVDDIVVLTELKNQLAQRGVYRFNEFKEVTNHIQFNCPMHKDGQESKPSCGITTANIQKDNRTYKAGTVHCFTCGYTATLPEMISQLFGYEDFGVFGERWLRHNFLTLKIEDRNDLQIDFDVRKHNKTKQSYITEQELDTYRYIHPYMYQRRLTDDIIELFDIGYDANFFISDKEDAKPLQCITFPIQDENGNVLYIARRCINFKLFHYPQNVTKPVYGLYQLKQMYEKCPDDIIICESMFNALTCWVYGKPAIALNGTGTPYQYKQLAKLDCKHFILGLDPDVAGDRGRDKIRKNLGKTKLISDYIIPKGKDINDLTEDEFNNLQIKSQFV